MHKFVMNPRYCPIPERVNTFETLLLIKMRVAGLVGWFDVCWGDSGRLIQTWSGSEGARGRPDTNRSGCYFQKRSSAFCRSR